MIKTVLILITIILIIVTTSSKISADEVQRIFARFSHIPDLHPATCTPTCPSNLKSETRGRRPLLRGRWWAWRVSGRLVAPLLGSRETTRVAGLGVRAKRGRRHDLLLAAALARAALVGVEGRGHEHRDESLLLDELRVRADDEAEVGADGEGEDGGEEVEGVLVQGRPHARPHHGRHHHHRQHHPRDQQPAPLLEWRGR